MALETETSVVERTGRRDEALEGRQESPVPSDLFEPSLRGRAARQQPYSDTAVFVLSFFGGGPAALGISLLNARRMGRPRTDVAVAVVCFALWLVLLFFVVRAASGQPAFDWLGEGADAMRSGRRLNQGAGLLFGGLFYLLHRSARRASHLGSEDPPKAWGVGLVLMLASIGVTALFALLITFLFGGPSIG